MMRGTTVGLFAGLLLGIALVVGDFGDMLVVALFGAIGFVVARVLEGDLDLNDLVSRGRPGPPRR
jgi:voltage-gated potassium channel Kch